MQLGGEAEEGEEGGLRVLQIEGQEEILRSDCFQGLRHLVTLARLLRHHPRCCPEEGQIYLQLFSYSFLFVT